MAVTGATVGAFRAALDPYFPSVDLGAYFVWMTVAGLLPADDGFGLVGVTPRQAALALIALSTGRAPREAPEAALCVADFKLRSISTWLPSVGWVTRPIELPQASVPSFLQFTEAQVDGVRGATSAGRGLTFVTTRNEAVVQIPVERGGGMMNFEPAQSQRDFDAEVGGGIGGALIEVVAGLFEPIEPKDIDPALIAGLTAALGLEPIVWH